MTHMAHTRVSVHAHMSLERASETILEPYNSHLLHYQQTEFTLSDTYKEPSVIEGCQSLCKSQSRVWRGGEKKGAIFIWVGLILPRGRLFLRQEGCEKRFKGSDVFKKGTSGINAVMNAAPSLGRVTVFTCFHLILNEAAILNYACCSDNPITKGKEWKDT